MNKVIRKGQIHASNQDRVELTENGWMDIFTEETTNLGLRMFICICIFSRVPDFSLQNPDENLQDVAHDGGSHHQAHVARLDGLQQLVRGRSPLTQRRCFEQAAVGVDPPPLLLNVAPGARVELLPGKIQNDFGIEQLAGRWGVAVQLPPGALQHFHHAGVHFVAKLKRELPLSGGQDGGDLGPQRGHGGEGVCLMLQGQSAEVD